MVLKGAACPSSGHPTIVSWVSVPVPTAHPVSADLLTSLSTHLMSTYHVCKARHWTNEEVGAGRQQEPSARVMPCVRMSLWELA